VPGLEDQDGKDFILDAAYDPVITDSIAPQAAFVSSQSFATGTRVFELCDLIFQIVEDLSLPLAIQLSKLAFRGLAEFNAPGLALS
jgi:hypothetical protein